MSIYKKTIIMVLCTSLALLGLVYMVSDSIYRRGFEKLEIQSTERNVIRVNEALSASLDALNTFCYDWSIWDDLYYFAPEYNQDFVDRNFGDETFIGAKMNLISIFNSSGKMVYGKAYDLINAEEIALSNDFIDTLQAYGLPDPVEKERVIRGIIQLSDQPMLVVSQPVLTSVGEGPSNGSIIMGRFLDSVFISSLSVTTHNSIELVPITNDFDPADYRNADQLNNSLPVLIQVSNKDIITGYTYCEDLNGNPALALKVEMSRDIYSQGMKALTFLQYSLIFFGVVFCVVFIFLIKKLILSRLTDLSRGVNKIGSSGNVSDRVSVSGNDELSGLADNINGMLTSLENADIKQRSQQELISHILASTPNAILVIDQSENVVLINKAFLSNFGLDTADIPGKNIRNLPALSGLVPEFQAFLSSHSINSRTEFQYVSENNKRIFIANFARINEDNLVSLVLADITQERQEQDRLFLTDRLVSVGQMASGVAHELNNPLTSIIGLSSLLTKQDVPVDVKEDLTAINSEAQRCASIVKSLLTFARKHTAAREPVVVTKILEDVIKLRAYEHKANNISVETSFYPGIPDILADYFQMQQVFLNIILNAEAAMIDTHGKGTLKISAQPVNSHVMISFSDDGQGISRENMRSIFNPFFTTKEVGKGTGLSLSISYGIVISHGGKIYAESEFGKGATFIVELPALKY